MDWRTLIYEYGYLRNQMEAEYNPESVISCVEDEGYYRLQRNRMKQLLCQHEERKLEPALRKTKIQIKAIQPIRNHLIATIRLCTTFEYYLHGKRYQEEKIENETITLTTQYGKWKIDGVRVSELEQQYSYIDGFIESPAEINGVKDVWGNASTDESNRMLPGITVPLVDERIAGLYRAERGKGEYDRNAAAEYADRWWEQGNPSYLEFEVDCSNYVSQCIFAGGAPMNYTNRRNSGWWYRGRSGGQEFWSYSWAVADSLRRYLSSSTTGLRAVQVNDPKQLAKGDVISYSWTGDDRYGHSTIVTAIDGSGMPLVNAHTVSSKHRFWDYKDSYAWTENTQYRFFHIIDTL